MDVQRALTRTEGGLSSSEAQPRGVAECLGDGQAWLTLSRTGWVGPSAGRGLRRKKITRAQKQREKKVSAMDISVQIQPNSRYFGLFWIVYIIIYVDFSRICRFFGGFTSSGFGQA
jgi:hypothetical protein